MIDARRVQTEPCVALNLEDDGLMMEVKAKLVEGAKHWTPEEAGQWFRQQWEEARQVLLISTVAQFVGGDRNLEMVRHGEVSWQLTEREGQMLAPSPPPPAAIVPTEAVPAAVPPQAEPAAIAAAQPAVEPETAPEPTSAAPAAPAEDETPADPQEAILALLIEAEKKGMTINALKAETGLNDYQTRTTIKKLKEAGRIKEKVKGRTATFTAR